MNKILPVFFLIIGFSLALPLRAEENKNPKADEAYRLATGVYHMELYKEAVEKLLAFRKSWPKDSRIDRVLYRLGESSLQLKKNKDALKYFSELHQEYSKSEFMPQTLFRLGELHLMAGKSQKAQTFFETFLKKYAKHNLAKTVREKLAEAFARGGNASKAAEVFKERLKTGKKTARLLLGYARALRDSGKEDDAIQQYDVLEKAFGESSEGLEGKVDFMYLYVSRGKNEELLRLTASFKARKDFVGEEALYLRGYVFSFPMPARPD